MTAVIIVDYGAGNLNSIARAFEAAGGQPVITSDAQAIRDAEYLLLPGVGAFAHCARKLTEAGLCDVVKRRAEVERPFLGICVGMQLLFDYSVEFERQDGLGILSGAVEPIEARSADGRVRKVPHIGWSPLEVSEARSSWHGTVLKNAEPGRTAMYFVHSFNCQPSDDTVRLADADYNGYKVCAVVQRGHVLGFQSHPEKSGEVGIAMLRNFLTA